MKPNVRLRSFLFLAGSSLLAITSTNAQTTVYWDGSDTTDTLANAQGGAGDWDDSTTNWDDAATAGNSLAWSNSSPYYIAVFGGSAGGTVNLLTGITAAGLTFNTTGYTIAGNTLTLAGATIPIIHVNTGSATISSVIAGSDGLKKTGAGTLIFTSTSNNTFTGGIEFNAGRIQYSSLTNANAWGDSSNVITFTGNATLYNLDGAYTLNRGIAIDPTFTATMLGAFGESTNVTGAVTGTGTLVIDGASNGWAVTLSNTSNTFTGAIRVLGGSGVASLSVASLGSSSNAITLGRNADGGTFSYSGSAALSRPFTLGGTTAAGTINSSGSGALTISSDLTIPNNGAKTLTLGGTGTAANTFSGIIGNSGSGATRITKADGGRWILSNTANTYTGITTISAGALEVTKLANGEANSSIGASTNAASNLVFNGGTLRYTGGGDSTDRAFTYSSTSAGSGWTIDSSGTGALEFTNSAAITFAGTGTQTRFFTLTGSNANDNIFAGQIVNNFGATTNQTNVTKSGLGKWVLTGTNSHTGSTFTNYGTLELRNPVGGTGITQTLGAMNFNQSEGTLISNNAGTGTLSTTFASAGRANGGTGNIIIQGTNNSINVTGGTQGFINVGTFFAGADYAARNATDGFIRALNYATIDGDPNAPDVDTPPADGIHSKLATSYSGAGVSLLSLNLAAGGVGWENTSGNLTVPGIIKSGGGAQSEIKGGSLTTLSNAELVIRTNTANDSLLINSNITGTSGGLTKSGAGTLTLGGTANTYTGTTRIQSGTLVMGASNLFGNSAAMVIDNATLNAATFTDTLGSLDINTPNATINLGAGAALAFANSSGLSWTDTTPGNRLTITGTFVSGSSLRFGLNNTGLTTTQLGLISASGWTNFALDASGYLTATSTGGGNTFANWIDDFAVGGLTGINDDFDNDGLGNALENLLGSNPSVSNQGLTNISATGGNLLFRHTLSTTPANDLTGAYEWSTNLVNWNASGVTSGGTTVTFATPMVITPGTPNLVEVTATVSGTPSTKIFARFKATQN